MPKKAHDKSAASNELRRELRERMLRLNFHAFANCMALVIEKMGAEEVRLTGRRNWKGRNSQGGYDLEATLPTAFGGGKRRVIIQVKQYDKISLYQRSIDELRGTCLRVGASEALLITTGTFAPSIDRSLLRLQESLVAPVRLIDGDSLLDLMLLHRIGVTTVEKNKTRRSTERSDQITIDELEDGVDTSLFDTLAQTHSGNSRLDCGGPRFLVRVQVQPMGKRTGDSASRGRMYQTYVVSKQAPQVVCSASTDCSQDDLRKPPLPRGTEGRA